MKSHLFGWKPVFRYLLVLFMLLGANLSGATHTVSDEGELINAITAVNASFEDDTITFTADIELEAELPRINKGTGTLTIEGGGHTLSRSSEAATRFRVLTIRNSTVDISNLTISGGHTDSSAGVLISNSITMLDNCTVSGNSTWGSVGGMFNNGGTIALTNCTVSHNSAVGVVGGIFNQGGTMTLDNCTVSGNSADFAGGIGNTGSMTLTNSTVSGNSAVTNGGGIMVESATNVTLTRSIIAGNTAQNGSEIHSDVGSTINADAHNVFGHSGLTNAQAFVGFTPGVTDVICTSDGSNAAALASILSPLADNGGSTLTHALVAGSPAIDNAPIGPDSDQRGISRPQGSGVDAGAYEFVPPVDPTDPDPVREFNYSHSLVSNIAKLNAWVLDPDARLGVGANWIMEGDLSRGFRFVGGMLVGMFDTTGTHTFRISGTDGTITVNHSFTVRVMAPTVCPTIFGAWINGDYLSIEVLEDACHGVAAQTALLPLTLERGQFTDIRFDWDYIKDDFGFCIIDGALPPGLVLDGRSGVISGVPTASGSNRFLVSVKDWRGRGYQWIEVNI